MMLGRFHAASMAVTAVVGAVLLGSNAPVVAAQVTPRSASVGVVRGTAVAPVDAIIVGSSGAPVAGATVVARGFSSIMGGPDLGSFTTTTSSDGSFTGGANLGPYIGFTVSIPAPNGSYGTAGTYPSSASGIVTFSFWRPSSDIGVGAPPTFTVPEVIAATIAVVDSSAQPVAGITVSANHWFAPCNGPWCQSQLIFNYLPSHLQDGNELMSCVTDVGGKCSLPALAGTTGELYVSPPRAIPARMGNFVMGSGPTSFSIHMPIEATISGKIQDSSGSAVAGASVWFADGSSGRSAQVQVSSDGAYSFMVAAGTQASLEVNASVVDGSLHPDGAGPAIASGTVRIEQTIPVSRSMTHDISIPGISMRPVRVVDDGGTALSDTSVWVGGSDLAGDWVIDNMPQGAFTGSTRVTFSPSVLGPFTCTTNNAGVCGLPALDGGSAQDVSINVPGALPYFTSSLAAAPQGSVTTLRMPVPLTISGLVTDASGAPATGVHVELRGISSGSPTRRGATETGQAGRYAFKTYNPGSYLLDITKSSSGATFADGSSNSLNQVGTFHNQLSLSVQKSVVQDFVLPSLVPVTFHDSPGAILTVFWLGGGGVFGAGPAVRWGLVPQEFSCTVDQNGICTLPGILGWTGYLGRSGVLQFVTATRNSSEIWLVNSAGSTPGVVQVSSLDGYPLGGVTSSTVNQATLPDGYVPVAGQVAFRVSGLTPGQSTSITVKLPSGSAPTKIVKLINGVVVDASAITSIGDPSIGGDANTVTLHVTDGGPGDEDGAANGTIVDPIVPVRELPTSPVVTQQPTDTSAAAGQSATFSARANGSPVPGVAWQESTDGGASFFSIPGATASVLVTTVSTASDGAMFRAQFTNSRGTTFSAPATLHLTGYHLRGILGAATRGQAYAAQLSASGALGPYKWKKLAALPKGLKLSTTGQVSGIINKKLTPGSYPIVVQASDATKKHPQVVQATWTIVIR